MWKRDTDEQGNDLYRVCAECHDGTEYFEEINCVSAGDESWDVCPMCGTIEGKTMYVTEEGKPC